MGDIEIRLANTSDADAISALTRKAYAKWVPLIGREPLPMTADYNEAIHKHRFDLLFVGDELAALIETVPLEGHLLIENLAVLPEHQGKGLGRKLLVHAEQTAVSMGYSLIRLYTNKRFEENLNFYQALGYQVEREEELLGGICVHMWKAV